MLASGKLQEVETCRVTARYPEEFLHLSTSYAWCRIALLQLLPGIVMCACNISLILVSYRTYNYRKQLIGAIGTIMSIKVKVDVNAKAGSLEDDQTLPSSHCDRKESQIAIINTAAITCSSHCDTAESFEYENASAKPSPLCEAVANSTYYGSATERFPYGNIAESSLMNDHTRETLPYDDAEESGNMDKVSPYGNTSERFPHGNIAESLVNDHTRETKPYDDAEESGNNMDNISTYFNATNLHGNIAEPSPCDTQAVDKISTTLGKNDIHFKVPAPTHLALPQKIQAILHPDDIGTDHCNSTSTLTEATAPEVSSPNSYLSSTSLAESQEREENCNLPQTNTTTCTQKLNQNIDLKINDPETQNSILSTADTTVTNCSPIETVSAPVVEVNALKPTGYKTKVTHPTVTIPSAQDPIQNSNQKISKSEHGNNYPTAHTFFDAIDYAQTYNSNSTLVNTDADMDGRSMARDPLSSSSSTSSLSSTVGVCNDGRTPSTCLSGAANLSDDVNSSQSALERLLSYSCSCGAESSMEEEPLKCRASLHTCDQSTDCDYTNSNGNLKVNCDILNQTEYGFITSGEGNFSKFCEKEKLSGDRLDYRDLKSDSQENKSLTEDNNCDILNKFDSLTFTSDGKSASSYESLPGNIQTGFDKQSGRESSHRRSLNEFNKEFYSISKSRNEIGFPFHYGNRPTDIRGNSDFCLKYQEPSTKFLNSVLDKQTQTHKYITTECPLDENSNAQIPTDFTTTTALHEELFAKDCEEIILKPLDINPRRPLDSKMSPTTLSTITTTTTTNDDVIVSATETITEETPTTTTSAAGAASAGTSSPRRRAPDASLAELRPTIMLVLVTSCTLLAELMVTVALFINFMNQVVIHDFVHKDSLVTFILVSNLVTLVSFPLNFVFFCGLSRPFRNALLSYFATLRSKTCRRGGHF